MTDIEILKQSLNGHHLEPKEVKVLKELVHQLTTDLNSRLHQESLARLEKEHVLGVSDVFVYKDAEGVFEDKEIIFNPDKTFAYCKPFAFAWVGGRFCFLHEKLGLVDLGDGGLSRENVTGLKSGKLEIDFLGNIEAHDTVFKLYDHGIKFDFRVLKNYTPPSGVPIDTIEELSQFCLACVNGQK